MLAENKYFLNGRYIFDPTNKSLTDQDKDGDVTWLGSNESNILMAFVERPNEVLSRDEIHDLVWTSNGFHVDESSVIQAISTVRKLLKDSAKNPSFIKTIPKHGYQFIGDSAPIISDPSVVLDKSKNNKSIKEQAPESETEKKRVNKNIPWNSFIIPVVIVVCGLLWMMAALSNKNAEFYRIARIEGVDIYSLNQGVMHGNQTSLLNDCVTVYLSSEEKRLGVDRLIVNFTSKDDLIINVINKLPLKSTTYAVMSPSVGMSNFCEMRLNRDQK